MTRRVDIGDGALEILELPDAHPQANRPPIVLLHEGLGSLGLWRDFPTGLHETAGTPRLIAYSRFGYGRSAPRPQPPDHTFLHREALEYLPALLATLDVQNPILVGHSDGATIALIHASRHRTAGLVAIAPHVVLEPAYRPPIKDARQAYEQDDLRERMARHHDNPDEAFYGWNDFWLDPAALAFDIRDEITSITEPVLLIQGLHDEYGSLAQLDAIEAAAQGPVRRLHLDCGHAPHLEAAAETTDAIAAFVAQLAAVRR